MSGIEHDSSHPAMGEISEHGVESTFAARPARAVSSKVLLLLIDDTQADPETYILEHLPWRGKSVPGCICTKTVMDSGASEGVAPPKVAPGVPTEESPGSKRGQSYKSACKERLSNMGQQRLDVVTNEGRPGKVLYHVVEVPRPLTAVSQTRDRGNIVVYFPDGGFIHNMTSGARTHFGRKNGGSMSLTSGSGLRRWKATASSWVLPGRGSE